MINEFNNIISKFKEINAKGYIKGINNNLLNSCGLTFENLLGKKADSMFFPDYNNIEIKILVVPNFIHSRPHVLFAFVQFLLFFIDLDVLYPTI